MRAVICGYVPEEGRVSMMRTANSIARNAAAVAEAGDTVVLHDERASEHARAAEPGRLVRVRKRVLAPLRMAACHADVIHIIDNDYAFGIAPWQYGRTLVTCHDFMPFWLDPSLQSIFSSPAGRYFCRAAVQNLARCAHVACVSAFTRDALLRQTDCPESRTSIIPQAVEDYFQPVDGDDAALVAFKEQHGLSGKRVILHVGACLAYKNIGMLLEVFSRLAEDGGDEPVLLKVGGHFSAADQAFITSRQLGTRIRHLHNLNEPDLVLAYNAADLLLWPSRFEGFGLPVLEAMACGTPVVCTNGGALPEVAADVARVHDPEDRDGMVESCRAILHRPELATSMASAGLDHAATFTWARTAAAYYALYKEIGA